MASAINCRQPRIFNGRSEKLGNSPHCGMSISAAYDQCIGFNPGIIGQWRLEGSAGGPIADVAWCRSDNVFTHLLREGIERSRTFIKVHNMPGRIWLACLELGKVNTRHRAEGGIKLPAGALVLARRAAPAGASVPELRAFG